jgi:hypothetical protein
MGSCRFCGMEWEASLIKDDSYIDTCAWCQVLRVAWRQKDVKEILYWSKRFVTAAKDRSIEEVIDIEKLN